MADKVEISAVHLSTIGDHVHVALEINGKWVEVIREAKDNAYSHIVEASGIEQASIEAKTTRANNIAACHDARDRMEGLTPTRPPNTSHTKS